VAGGGEQHVVRLDVPVDDAAAVQVLQGQHALGQVEHSLLLEEIIVDAEQGLEVATDHVFHHHEHIVGGLHAVEQRHAELRLSQSGCISLRDDLCNRNYIQTFQTYLRRT
jgi:hypothetical protein